jgi:hypothetical protein
MILSKVFAASDNFIDIISYETNNSLVVLSKCTSLGVAKNDEYTKIHVKAITLIPKNFKADAFILDINDTFFSSNKRVSGLYL